MSDFTTKAFRRVLELNQGTLKTSYNYVAARLDVSTDDHGFLTDEGIARRAERLWAAASELPSKQHHDKITGQAARMWDATAKQASNLRDERVVGHAKRLWEATAKQVSTLTGEKVVRQTEALVEATPSQASSITNEAVPAPVERALEATAGPPDEPSPEQRQLRLRAAALLVIVAPDDARVEEALPRFEPTAIGPFLRGVRDRAQPSALAKFDLMPHLASLHPRLVARWVECLLEVGDAERAGAALDATLVRAGAARVLHELAVRLHEETGASVAAQHHRQLLDLVKGETSL